MADNHEKSGLEHTAQAAGAVRGAMKAGKALAGASKGAAFGPYGMAAGLAWEGRKVIGKVILAVTAFLLLPVVLLMMLPGALFGGGDADDPLNLSAENAVWDESAVEEILFDDYGAVSETFNDACDAVDSVMQSAYEQVLLDIHKQNRCGVLFVTHSIDEALAIADRIVILENHQAKKVYPVGDHWRHSCSEEDRRALRQDILSSIQL